MSAVQFPVEAREWSCHAPTTIVDARGVVIAECSGFGRRSEIDSAAAAEIVRRLNAHDQLLQALQFVVRFHDQLTPADIQRAKEAIAAAGGAS